jgi:hypothetical protein
MPINLDIVGACERIVAEADRLSGENYAFNLRKKNGALSFITSPENGGVQSDLISYQSGRKLANLHVYHDQRTKACQISDNCDQNVCDEGSTPLRKEFDVTIDTCVRTPVREYSNNDMAALCKDTEAFMRDRGFSDLIAAHEHMDKKVLAFLDGEIGVNYEFDGTTTAAGAYKSIDIIGTAGGQPVPLPGNWEVNLDYENNQLTGIPAVIGQGNLRRFYELQRWSCCNATTPYGDQDFEGFARFYMDQSANEVLGADNFLAVTFGTNHMLTFNENANIQATGVNTADRMNIVVPDPFGYPFSWNFDFYFDNCTKSWKSMWSLLYGFFNVYNENSFAGSGDDSSPDTSPDCDDDLLGMTGVFGYTAA